MTCHDGRIEIDLSKRIRGICADARILGVTREHLTRVLRGQRVSASLTRRYFELKRRTQRQASTAPTSPT